MYSYIVVADSGTILDTRASDFHIAMMIEMNISKTSAMWFTYPFMFHRCIEAVRSILGLV